jgi:hypothetical protein
VNCDTHEGGSGIGIHRRALESSEQIDELRRVRAGLLQ